MPKALTDKEKETLINTVCDRIEKGEALRNVLKDLKRGTHTFYDIIDENPEFTQQYARACELRAESIFEEILTIADNTEDGITIQETDNKTKITRGDMIQHRRLKVDARKWMLSKMMPKKYGDKVDVTSDGKELQPNKIDVSTLPTSVLEELKRAKKGQNED
jgi:hypothetical protein